MANETRKLGQVITGIVRFSYCHVFEPKAIEEGQEPKYSVSILIPKTDKATLAVINQAIEDVKANTDAIAKWGGKLPAKLKLPLRDGDEERPDDEAYKGHFFVNANCSAKSKPQIIDGKSRTFITDESGFYSGCYGRASVTFYAFAASGSKGIACGLNNLLKTDDGESLAGKSSALDDFADFIDGDSLL